MSAGHELLETVCFVVLIIIISIGLIGNFISLIIWSCGEKSKSLACSTYFKLISISDICVLLSAGVYELLRFYPVRFTITKYSTFVCKSVTFGRLFTTQISTWLVVTVTIERTVSILFPLRHKTAGARKRAIISALAISVLAFSLTLVFLIAMDVTDDIDSVDKGKNNESFYWNANNVSKSKTETFTMNFTDACKLIETDSTLHNMAEGDGMTGNITEISNKNTCDVINAPDILTSTRKTQLSVLRNENTAAHNGNETVIHFRNETAENLTSGQIPGEDQWCDFLNLPRSVETIAWTLNYVLLICCIPLSIILVCNMIILVKLCQSCKLGKATSIRAVNSLVVFTRLVLAIGFVYILSTLPMTLYVLTHFDILKVEIEIRKSDVLSEIARTLFCLNNGANFLLYFTSGKKFRKDFNHFYRHLFKKCTRT